MNNITIIYNEILKNKLMTKPELEKYIKENGDIPLYRTFKEWNKLGYQIQKGEKARIITKLWYLKKGKIDKTKEMSEENTTEKFILVKSYLFDIDQVKKT